MFAYLAWADEKTVLHLVAGGVAAAGASGYSTALTRQPWRSYQLLGTAGAQGDSFQNFALSAQLQDL